MLKVKNLHISFPYEKEHISVVHDLNFTLAKGQTLGIVGESGSGKSITALCVMGLLPPNARIDKGEILYGTDDKEADLVDLRLHHESRMRRIRGSNISMIFQEPMTCLNPVQRCGVQVKEAIRATRFLADNFVVKLKKKEKLEDRGSQLAAKKVLNLFEKVKLPDPARIYKAFPHELSGGQKQRVMIAMAIANKPDILIADEPTTALDVTVQKSILELLKDIQEEYGMSILFITHDLGVVKTIADEVLVMRKGEVVESGEVKDVFNTPKHPYTKGLLECRPKLGEKVERLRTLDDAAKHSSAKRQRPEEEKNLEKKETFLKVSNLNVNFSLTRNLLGKTTRELKAVKEASFELQLGETLGLVGESGSGKTSLGRSMLKLIPKFSGKIIYFDKDISDYSCRKFRELRKEMQIIFQDPYASLNPRISIGNAILEPMNVHALHGGKKQRLEKVYELLEKVGLEAAHFNRYPHEFSGGQRQRICIARALALDPKLIICDESVSALDVSVQARVLNLLNDIKAEFGLSLIFISHDLAVVKHMANHIIVMKDGEIVEQGDAEEIYKHPRSEYTKKLIHAAESIACLSR